MIRVTSCRFCTVRGRGSNGPSRRESLSCARNGRVEDVSADLCKLRLDAGVPSEFRTRLVILLSAHFPSFKQSPYVLGELDSASESETRTRDCIACPDKIGGVSSDALEVAGQVMRSEVGAWDEPPMASRSGRRGNVNAASG